MTKSTEITSSFIDRDEQWPPGFRFHPTDEELVLYYLKRKMCRRSLKLDVISDIDVYKADPDELPGLSRLKTGDRQWFFFSPRDRKYPNGGRSNRATRLGYWKATGKDRVITCNSRTVGIKKTLVFYKGRAPSGERTDWVMHEYTLDEEELKRCPAQDYYALYKVFKKSGPGPKNGEQYGAPFCEEVWDDDDKAVVTIAAEQAPPPLQNVDNTRRNCEAQMNTLDMFLKEVANDPLFQPLSVDFSNVLAAGRNEQTSTVVDPSLVELNVQRGIAIPSLGQFNDVQPCVNLAQSASSQFRGTSGVTSATTNMSRQGSHESEEDLFQDFLELDDLVSPELTSQNNENYDDDFRIEDFDGLCESDLFQDVSMFLQEMGDTEPASRTDDNNVGARMCNPTPVSCPNHLYNGEVDQGPNSYSYFQSEMGHSISQPYYYSLANGMVNQFNYQMPNATDVASQLWMQNQNSNNATPVVSNQESVIPPTSGVVCAGVNQNQSQDTNVNEAGESWFSSTLWSFVEAIPTTPASAAESTALVNKAFERLSSFSKRAESVKVSLLVTSANAVNPTSPRRRSQNKCNRGFLLFSVVGVLCAVLWMFTGTSVR